jgi:hypothetical protein
VPHLKKSNTAQKLTYRPEQYLCPVCQSVLRRTHIAWRKYLIFSTGDQMITSWAYRCSGIDCPGSKTVYQSAKAEKLHLRKRRFSRELVVRIGHQHFWQHQTMYEIHDWLTQDLHVAICKREVANLLVDFLALLGAAQPAKIRRKLRSLKGMMIGIDGMQPEKGNDCLYIARELQCGVTLLAENLEESSQDALCERIIEPLKDLGKELGLAWRGVVSDAQETIQLAIAKSLQGVPHQACQSHCLRDAGKLTFEGDRAVKTDLKAAFRHTIPRLRKRIQVLSAQDPFRAVLLDYVSVIRSLLLEGGIAPFELGGIKIFDALEGLEASVIRCQKKATTSYYAV